MDPTESKQIFEHGTRDKLLHAAGEVFAERGFREATIRDICGLAGVNIAAVNYHFRDKEGLYREVIQSAACMALEKYPIGGRVPADAGPEDRLRAFVHTYLDRLLDEGRPAWHGRLIAREMVDPTPVLDELVEGFVRPQYHRLRAIVADLLGPASTDERVTYCVTSVVGQCLFFKNCRPVIERLIPNVGYDEQWRRALGEHIAAFSLSAIAALKSGAEGKAGGEA